MKLAKQLTMSAAIAAGVIGYASTASAIAITGWTGSGNYGVSGADGDVSASPFPGSTQYGWVSTNGGVNGVGLPGIGGTGAPTNGSVLTSTAFTAEAGDLLEFYFNFITSDGAGFADYAWARLLNADLTPAALLFTARTTPGGNTVPGFQMPAPAATLTPSNTPITGTAPDWSPLGASSGTCYDTGCGYTDWIKASFEITSSADYVLEFGVVNWNDTEYDSGLAFDGATIGGVQIDDPVSVPEPGSLALLGLGLAGLATAARRRRD